MTEGHEPNRAPVDLTRRVARLVALSSSVIAALYVVTRAEPAPVVQLYVIFAPAVAVILWLQKDARRTKVGAVLDLGYFLWLAWPVVIPWYALKTRGPSGWRLIAELFGLIAAPHVTAVVVN